MFTKGLPVVWIAISFIALAVLVSLVFLGSTLMADLSGLTTYLVAMSASAVIAIAVAVPTAIMSKSRLGDERPV